MRHRQTNFAKGKMLIYAISAVVLAILGGVLFFTEPDPKMAYYVWIAAAVQMVLFLAMFYIRRVQGHRDW